MSNDLVRYWLFYDIEVSLSITATGCRTCRAFVDSVLNKCNEKHWYHKFMSVDFSLCDETRSRRQYALDDEALQAAIEEDQRTYKIV